MSSKSEKVPGAHGHVDPIGRPRSLGTRIEDSLLRVFKLKGAIWRTDTAQVTSHDHLRAYNLPLSVWESFTGNLAPEAHDTLAVSGEEMLATQIPVIYQVLDQLPGGLPATFAPIVAATILGNRKTPELRWGAAKSAFQPLFDQLKGDPDKLFTDPKGLDNVQNAADIALALRARRLLSASPVDPELLARLIRRYEAIDTVPNILRGRNKLSRTPTLAGVPPEATVKAERGMIDYARGLLVTPKTLPLLPTMLAFGTPVIDGGEYPTWKDEMVEGESLSDLLMKEAKMKPQVSHDKSQPHRLVRDPSVVANVINRLIWAPDTNSQLKIAEQLPATALATLMPTPMRLIVAGMIANEMGPNNGLNSDLATMMENMPKNISAQASFRAVQRLMKYGSRWAAQIYDDSWGKDILQQVLYPSFPAQVTPDLAHLIPTGSQHLDLALQDWRSLGADTATAVSTILKSGDNSVNKQVFNAVKLCVHRAFGPRSADSSGYLFAVMQHFSLATLAQKFEAQQVEQDANGKQNIHPKNAERLAGYQAQVAQQILVSLFGAESNYKAIRFLAGERTQQSSNGVGWKTYDYQRAYVALSHLVDECPSVTDQIKVVISSIITDARMHGTKTTYNVNSLLFLDRLKKLGLQHENAQKGEMNEKSGDNENQEVTLTSACLTALDAIATDTLVNNLGSKVHLDTDLLKRNGFKTHKEYYEYNIGNIGIAYDALKGNGVTPADQGNKLAQKLVVGIIATIRSSFNSLKKAVYQSEDGEQDPGTTYADAMYSMGSTILAKLDTGSPLHTQLSEVLKLYKQPDDVARTGK